MEKKSKFEFVLFILSIITCIFWIFSQLFDVYKYKIIGVFFELAFLPMLILFFVLPILVLIQVIKSKKIFKSLSSISLLILMVTILIIMFRTSYLK